MVEGQRRARAAVALMALAASAVATRAHADEFPPDVVAVLAGESKPARELTFVGRSGQIYRPQGETWKRQVVGGIASDVLGAVTAKGALYAVPDRAPLFVRKNGVWLADPLTNRGRATLTTGGARILVALGRHIYRLDGARWTRFATADRRVTALYAQSPTSVVVATTRGRLRRTDGRTSTVIKNSLPTEDYVRALSGGRNRDLYGVSNEGVILEIGSRDATVITPSGDLAGLRIHVLGRGPDGAVLAAGVVSAVPAPETTEAAAASDAASAVPDAAPTETATGAFASAPAPHWVLVALRGGAATKVTDLDVPAGDRVSVVHTAADGRLVVATYGGSVGIQNPDGTWEQRRVSGAAPSASVEPNAPAHTR